MKISKVPGEFGFKALFQLTSGWVLSEQYFFSLEDAKCTCPSTMNIKWPVEVYENGSIYIPTEDELNEEESNTKTS